MKLISAFLFFFGVALVSMTASAQGTVNTVSKLSPEAAACLRACAAKKTTPTATPVCGGLDQATKARIEKLVGEISALQAQLVAQATKLAENEKKLALLEGRVSGLANVKDEISGLRSVNLGIVRDIAAIRAANAKFLETYGLTITGLVSGILELQSEYEALESRVTMLESKIWYGLIGVRAGAIGLVGSDGSTYSGGVVGPRLTLSLGPKTWFTVDTDVTVASSQNPLGMHVRGGVGYDFHPNWYVNGGISATGVGFDSRLMTQANYWMADVGVGVHSDRFFAGANALAGVKQTSKSTDAAFGGVFILGVTF